MKKIITIKEQILNMKEYLNTIEFVLNNLPDFFEKYLEFNDCYDDDEARYDALFEYIQYYENVLKLIGFDIVLLRKYDKSKFKNNDLDEDLEIEMKRVNNAILLRLKNKNKKRSI